MDHENINKIRIFFALEFLSKSKKNIYTPKEHIDIINDIIDKYTVKNEQKNDTEISKMYKLIETDSYSRQWNRINSVYKINKIKEYMDEYAVKNKIKKQLKEKIINELVSEINSGGLKSSKDVIYDKKEMKIKDIPGIEIVDGKFILKKKGLKKK